MNRPENLSLRDKIEWIIKELRKLKGGVSNVNNTSDVDKPISTATQTALDLKVDKVAGKQLSTEDYTTSEKNKLAGIQSGAEVNVNADWNAISGDAQILNKPSTFTPSAHTHPISQVDNLQTTLDGKESTISAGTTGQYWRGDKTWQTLNKSAVGLSNVDNTSDANKPISNATQSALNAKADLVNGVIPSSQLPSFVDDVLEFANLASFPATGESGKIYVALNTNLTYRWSGTTYAEISPSLALGETESTAYRGDRGKIAYDHSQTIGNPHNTTKSDIGLGNVDNTSDLDKPISTATQLALNDKQNLLTNPITGTGANGQVAFFNGTTTQIGDNGLFWDNTNKGLGVGVTGNIVSSAIMEARSTTKGFLPPRMTTTQRDAIATPAAGLIVYDTTENKHYGYNGTSWYNMDADIVTTNRQSASYTLTLTDRSKLIEMDVATANNLIIPLNSSVAFPIGTKIDVVQYGAGQTTFVPTSGVTIRSANNWLKMNARYGAATLTKIGTDEWYLWGNLNA